MCRVLFVVGCVLVVVCLLCVLLLIVDLWWLCAVRCELSVACCVLLLVARCALFVACCALRVVCFVLCVGT